MKLQTLAQISLGSAVIAVVATAPLTMLPTAVALGAAALAIKNNTTSMETGSSAPSMSPPDPQTLFALSRYEKEAKTHHHQKRSILDFLGRFNPEVFNPCDYEGAKGLCDFAGDGAECGEDMLKAIESTPGGSLEAEEYLEKHWEPLSKGAGEEIKKWEKEKENGPWHLDQLDKWKGIKKQIESYAPASTQEPTSTLKFTSPPPTVSTTEGPPGPCQLAERVDDNYRDLDTCIKEGHAYLPFERSHHVCIFQNNCSEPLRVSIKGGRSYILGENDLTVSFNRPIPHCLEEGHKPDPDPDRPQLSKVSQEEKDNFTHTYSKVIRAFFKEEKCDKEAEDAIQEASLKG